LPERLAAQATPAGLAWLASGRTYEFPPHLQLLDEALWEIATRPNGRLMVFMPPRHGKSMTCSQYFPAWCVGALDRRVILTSYEASFAASWGRKARTVMEQFGWLYGAKVSEQSQAGNWWELEAPRAGLMQTAGAGGPITGKGADILGVDDPIKNAEDASSAAMRDALWEWWTTTAYTRLEPGGSVYIVHTRWNDDDLGGRLLKQMADRSGEEWRVLDLPAIAEADEAIPLLHGGSYDRAAGEPLWPGRYPLAELERIRMQVGPKAWSALYQQNPVPDGGLIWMLDWLNQTYAADEVEEARQQGALRRLWKLRKVVNVVDSAYKTGVSNDYSVIATWAANGTDYLLLDVWRGRVEFPGLIAAIRRQADKWSPDVTLIEDAASGTSAMQEMRRQTREAVLGWKPVGTKEARAAAVSPIAATGKLLLPDHAPWLADWVDEHVRFPNAPHDDQVDTTSMALEYLRDEPRKKLVTF
jgi:predicted phage terminase large subunit-like protein